MCIAKGSETPVPLHAVPELQPIQSFDSGGLSFQPRHAFRTGAGAPGYLFDVRENGDLIGSAAVVVTSNPAAVRDCGHVGCEVDTKFRGRGYPPRMVKPLLPILRSHGITEALINCETANKPMYDHIRQVGGVLFDELPGSAEQSPRTRFRVTL